MTQAPSPEPPTESPSTDAPQGIARLARMSTTAGVGLQEYKAINPWAVTSVITGVASWAASLSLLLLVLPLLAVVAGAVALIQIRRSHGTQSGTLIAILGLGLGAAIGGWITFSEVQARIDQRRYNAEIEATVEEFGRLLSNEDYAAAYALTDPIFQRAVTADAFAATFRSFGRSTDAQGQPTVMPPTGADTNERTRSRVDPGTGEVLAEAMLILTYPNGSEVRQPVGLVLMPDGWRFYDFGDWFAME